MNAWQSKVMFGSNGGKIIVNSGKCPRVVCGKEIFDVQEVVFVWSVSCLLGCCVCLRGE